jgi:hypothetical protein
MRRLIFAFALLVGWSGAAAAETSDNCYSGDGKCDHMYCDQYIALAVAMAQKAAEHNCGFSGPRWSTNPDDHRQACSGESVTDPQAFKILQEEEKARFQGELKCEICQGENRDAMKDVAAAAALHCAFLDKSPIWPSSANGQYNVCMNSEWWSALFVLSHTDNAATRRSDLAACRKQNALRAGIFQGKSLSATRREDRAKMLQGAVRKVPPCPPELGPNCNKPQQSHAINPGLLESDGGFTRQGPSGTGAAGAPRGPAASSSFVR